MGAEPVDGLRDVILGCNSKVWLALSKVPAISKHFRYAIGHRDLGRFEFTPADRVWVFSYSRSPAENHAIFQRLGAAGVAEVIYISSSSTIIDAQTRCYEYPRVKRLAESSALDLPQARLLVVGMVYERAEELPAGDNIATSHAEFAAFMLAPDWPTCNARQRQLFNVVSRPFGGRSEQLLYRIYGRLINLAGPYPCLLRPIDLLLRQLKMHWYGYVFLSNQRWISTTL